MCGGLQVIEVLRRLPEQPAALAEAVDVAQMSKLELEAALRQLTAPSVLESTTRTAFAEELVHQLVRHLLHSPLQMHGRPGTVWLELRKRTNYLAFHFGGHDSLEVEKADSAAVTVLNRKYNLHAFGSSACHPA